jgi:hypothetical protein
MLTLQNDFHNTSVSLRAKRGQELSLAQVRRARRILCGITACNCGGTLGQRGANPEVDAFGYDQTGHLRVRVL